MAITFTIIPWNSSAYDDYGGERGVSSESIQGSFTFDVSFRSNRAGFVVQNIRKYTSYIKNVSRSPPPGDSDSRWGGMDYESCGDDCTEKCTHLCYQYHNKWQVVNSDKCKHLPLPEEEKVECKIDDYWEIFYIGKDGKSWNEDRFSQIGLGTDSEGTIIQIGYAYFFSYPKSVTQKGGVIEFTLPIKKIFGPEFMANTNVRLADGLPSSEHKPTMKGLRPIENVIVRKLTAKWGKHEPESNFDQKGWDTVITEEAFGGFKVYEDFPYRGNVLRPFDPNSDQWTNIPLHREPEYKGLLFYCPECSHHHFKGDWWVYHDPDKPGKPPKREMERLEQLFPKPKRKPKRKPRRKPGRGPKPRPKPTRILTRTRSQVECQCDDRLTRRLRRQS